MRKSSMFVVLAGIIFSTAYTQNFSGNVHPVTGNKIPGKNALHNVAIQNVPAKVPACQYLQNSKINPASTFKTPDWCLADKVTNNYIQFQSVNDPDYSIKMNKMYQQVQQWITANPNYLAQKAVKTIPVVVHVLYNNAAENVSTALINDMINTLNEDFRRLNADTTDTRATFLSVASDAQIEFCLAIRDPNNNTTTGIIRKSSTQTWWDPDTETDDMKLNSTGGDDAWDPYSYLNIWICDIDNGAGFGTAGYAYLPSAGMHGSWRDGLVIDNNIGICPGCRTATHEIGHYLGLKHTWGNNPPSCSNDDGFSDTPTNADENYGCNYAQNTCNDGAGDKPDQIENYMSYADCQNMYSTMQANYMNSVLNTTRSSLLTSDGCQPAAPPVADFTATPNPVYVGSAVQFTDISSGYPTSWSWNFGGGGTPNTSALQNPLITFNTIGTYSVTLTATNSLGTDQEIKNGYISVIAMPPCGIPGAIFCEDFESVTPPALPTGWSTTGNATSDLFMTGTGTTASSQYFTIPDHTQFVYSNDDNCNCNKANDILRLPTQNFTGYNNVVMTFNSIMSDDLNASFLDSTYVQVSTNGGSSWTYVYSIPKVAAWTNYIVNLSAYDNMNNVLIRFRYTDKGNWGYGIAIDDVIIKENFDNDIKISGINKYDTLQYPDYLLVPNRQTGDIIPMGLVENVGANVQQGVALNVTVYDPNGIIIYDTTSNSVTLNPWTSTVLSTAVLNIPKTGTGTFTFVFTASSDSTDEDPSNNSFTDYYVVTDTIYERMDTIPPYYALAAASFGGAAPYRFANLYEIVNNDTATSVSFVPWTSSIAGSQVRVVLYDSSLTQIAQSNPYTLQTSDLGNIVTVSFSTGVPLTAGIWYLASVNSLSAVDSAVTFLSGSLGGGSQPSYIYTDVGAGFNWYSFSYVPWILLNTAPSVINCNDAVSVTITNTSCGTCNGQATVSVTGPNGPFTYQWNDGAGQTSATATGLCTGSYQVLVKNQYCTYVNGGSVNTTAQMTLNVTSTDASCGLNNASATASVTGGALPFTYAWSNAQTGSTATGLAAGTYNVTVTDNAGCSIATDFFNAAVVSNTPYINDAVATGTNATCNGVSNGSVTVTATTGVTPYAYAWSSGCTTSSCSAGAGTYTVTVSDNFGCTDVATVNITEPPLLNASISSSSNLTCYGNNNGSAAVTASGGTGSLSYLWSSGSTLSSATGLGAGTVTVTVTDANSCTKTASVVLTQPAQINVSTSTTAANCGSSNGTATVTATGGTGTLSYLWSSGGQTSSIATGLAAGTYTVTVSDANSCSNTTTATVSNPGAPTVSAAQSVQILCNGQNTGSATATASGAGPFSYIWSSGAQTTSVATGLAAGTYTVTVTDAVSCSNSASVTVTQPAAITIVTTPSGVTCNGGSNGTVSATASGGTTPFTYSWSSGTTSGLSPGIYTVTVTDNNGCTATQTATVTEPALLSVSATSTAVSCYGGNDGTVSATGSGGTLPYNYFWSSGSTSGLAAGTYTVTVSDANGCWVQQSTTVTQPVQMVLVVDTNNASCSTCANGYASATVSGGNSPYTYLWSNGATSSITFGLLPGNYDVTVTDASGCSEFQSLVISYPVAVQPAAPEAVIELFPNPSDGIVFLNYEPSVSGVIHVEISNLLGETIYSCNNTGGIFPIDVSGLCTGVYLVKISSDKTFFVKRVTVINNE
ncbi:MAG: T9SS type A sorting domain-containing protein [Bacteroidetes bacterium]|nr:T9SS type A sorting domain-containing protein [Bacteroidota bacterium]